MLTDTGYFLRKIYNCTIPLPSLPLHRFLPLLFPPLPNLLPGSRGITPEKILGIRDAQKRATKLVISLKKACYSDRLKSLNLPTLKYRRLRGDMIEVYKILSGKYDSDVAPVLITNDSVTRGNKYKLSIVFVMT